MKLLKEFSILTKTTVASILISVLVPSAISFYFYQNQVNQLVTDTKKSLGLSVDRMQIAIDDALASNHKIPSFHDLENLNVLFVVDGTRSIIASSNPEMTGISILEKYPLFSEDHADRATRGAQQVIQLHHPDTFVFYHPLKFTKEYLNQSLLVGDYSISDQIEYIQASYRVLTLILTSILLTIGLTLRFWLKSQFVKPLSIATEKNRLAHKQEFTEALHLNQNSEVTALANSINELQRAIRTTLTELEHSEALYRIFASSVPEASAVVTQTGNLVAAFGPEGALFSELKSGDAITKSLPSPTAMLINNKLREARGLDRRITVEINLGEQFNNEFFLFSFSPIQSPISGQPVMLVSTYNISEQKKHEKTLGVLASVFESREAIVITDEQTRILRVNTEFCRLTGYLEKDIIGNTTDILATTKHNSEFWHSVWQKVMYEGSWMGELEVKKKDERNIPVRQTISVVKDSDEITQNYVIVFTDISEQRKAMSLIRYHANFDTLTDLPNRRMLMAQLNRLMAQGSRHGFFSALLFLDLDNFKQINDSYGHPVGDQLLLEVAKIIKSRLRTEDFIARLGGDEFVVLLHQLDKDQNSAARKALSISNNLARALKESSVHINQMRISTTASIGITLFPKKGSTAFDLLREADTAMYQAKSIGRNQVSFFSTEMQKQVTHTLNLVNQLNQAIDKEEFKLVYQPQINANNEIVGAEALVRWFSRQGDAIPPAEFIPHAEDSGSIIELGNLIFKRATQDLTKMQQQGLPESFRRLAINISPRQLMSENFKNQVEQAIDHSGASPSRIELEITESSLFENRTQTSGILDELKNKGFTFSIDDFGTGYSSLSYLKQLPIEKLKIDQYFVRDVAKDTSDAQIVKTIITMAYAMGLNVIAEGVETSEQLEFLKQNQCFEFQGYYFSKPLTLDDFLARYCRH